LIQNGKKVLKYILLLHNQTSIHLSSVLNCVVFILLSHCDEYPCECHSPLARNDHKPVARHSYAFASIRRRSWDFINIRNMLLIFARNLCSHHYRKGFVNSLNALASMASHLYRSYKHSLGSSKDFLPPGFTSDLRMLQLPVNRLGMKRIAYNFLTNL